MLGWNDIRGQRAAQGVLERAVETDRVHHGYLFVGPHGVGKFTTALAFAAVMNCSERQAGTFAPACGRCISCRKAAGGQHPDLHVVVPEGGVNKFIKIAQVRAIQKVAMTRPYEAPFQIVIFDDAHAMTDEAANALLKTLEEPPDRMHIVLVTDRPHALLDTTRSRCQLVRFGALDVEVAMDVLAGLVDGVDPQLLAVAARFGEGSLGKAREALDSGLLQGRGDLLRSLATINTSAASSLLDTAAELAKDRTALPAQLDLLVTFWRDALMVRIHGDSADLINHDHAGVVRDLANRYDTEAILDRLERVRVASQMLEMNVHPLMVVENLVTELASDAMPSKVRLPRF